MDVERIAGLVWWLKIAFLAVPVVAVALILYRAMRRH
jgi:hypothetical protein